MNSIRAISLGALAGWLLVCVVFDILILFDGDFDTRNGVLLTLVIYPFWIAVAMFPGFLLIGILRFYFPPSNPFWSYKVCSVVGFFVGVGIIFLWWILIAGVRHAIPPLYEPRTWFFTLTAGFSAALSFSVTAKYLKKRIQA